MSSLEILPITPLNNNEKLPYHPHLPSVAKNRGFILTLIGSTASGRFLPFSQRTLHLLYEV